MKPTTIWLKPADGAWEALGVDTRRGVWAANVELTANKGGSARATFDVLRDGRQPWPDLLAATPVVVEVAGVRVWKGRVAGTPARLGGGKDGLSVECEGVQAHLDDDQYERVYVHTNLGDWKDARSFIDADLSTFRQAGQVSGEGGIVVGWPKDAAIVNTSQCGVILDLGPGSTAKRVVFTYEWSNGTGNGNQYMLCYAGDSVAAMTDSVVSDNPGTGSTSGTATATLSTARRFLRISVYSAAGSDFTATDELRLRITSCMVFADLDYGYDSSILTIDQVALDAIDRATILLSDDTSKVETGTFYIPEFAPDGPRTPRQMIEAANAFEDMQVAVDVEDRLVLRALPTTPVATINASSAVEFEDTSAGQLAEVHSRVIVKGQGPDGTPVRVSRSQAEQPGVQLEPATTPAPTNPSFATNTTGWTATGSSITRDTGTYDTSPASGRWDGSGASDALAGGDILSTTFSGTFFAGVTYQATVRVKRSSATTGQHIFPALGVPGGDEETNIEFVNVSTSWVSLTVTWTPSADTTSAVLRLLNVTSSAFFYVDSVELYSASPTIVDRQGFKRTHTLDASFMLTTGAATQLADKYLAAHKTTPFAGRLKTTGPLPDYLTGLPVPPEALLLRAGEPLHFADRVDPDTGAWGRDGRMVQVTYKPELDEATVDVDNSRADFNALLERLGVAIGVGTR